MYRINKKFFKALLWVLVILLAVSVVEGIIIFKLKSNYCDVIDSIYEKIDNIDAHTINDNSELTCNYECEVDEYESYEESWYPNQEDVESIAKTLYGECRGVSSKTQKSAVAWCVLNRLDSGYYGDSVYAVVSAPYQFAGYNENNPLTDDLVSLAVDVLVRWHRECLGERDVGRVLPKNYIYFFGDGKYNYFTSKWRGNEYWDWSLESPYEN